MLICSCSLAGTKECLTCPYFLAEMGTPITKVYGPPPMFEPEKKVRRTTRTYEYDAEGRVIKEVVEEECD